MHPPHAIITNFIEIYESKDHAQDQLFIMLEAAMQSGYADDWTGDERGDMIFFCKQVADIIEAVFLLYPSNENNAKNG